MAIAGQPGVVYTPESGRDLPAVAFGHGWLTRPDNYRTLLEHLASWGFVVAAPDTERGPIPSHLGLATDLLTALDVCRGVRLGDGTISVHPDRLALVGHGMGAGAAVLAAAQRRVGAVAALFPAPTTPAAESYAPDLNTGGLVLAGEDDLASMTSNARALAGALGGTRILRTVDGADQNGIVEGRRMLSALGAGKHNGTTTRVTRGLLTGYLRHTLLGDKTYAAFGDPEAEIPRTRLVDPTAAPEEKPSQSNAAKVGQVAKALRS